MNAVATRLQDKTCYNACYTFGVKDKGAHVNVEIIVRVMVWLLVMESLLRA